MGRYGIMKCSKCHNELGYVDIERDDIPLGDLDFICGSCITSRRIRHE